jgi:hypothetical protein
MLDKIAQNIMFRNHREAKKCFPKSDPMTILLKITKI